MLSGQARVFAPHEVSETKKPLLSQRRTLAVWPFGVPSSPRDRPFRSFLIREQRDLQLPRELYPAALRMFACRKSTTRR
jgi:hypothetical protein